MIADGVAARENIELAQDIPAPPMMVYDHPDISFSMNNNSYLRRDTVEADFKMSVPGLRYPGLDNEARVTLR